MRILISNDDGYLSPGTALLAERLMHHADIAVVVPDRNRSGASNSLTLDRPLRAIIGDNGFYRINGTPTDCVHLAITGLLDDEPDMVISGINAGANLGDDVLYSGTVAAAMEGRFLGYPAMAVSLTGERHEHLNTAVRAVETLLSRLTRSTLPSDIILNVNVPDVPESELTGYEITRLGHRHKAEAVIKAHDPRGETIYWVSQQETQQLSDDR